MKKSQVKMEYSSSSITGLATFTDKQLESLTYGAGVSRLRDDLLYVIPRQWVHAAKLARAFNGHEYSNKVFAFGCIVENDETIVVSMCEIAANSFKTSFYGKVSEFPDGMRISAVKKGDVYRAASGTSLESVFSNGGVQFEKKGSNCYVSKDIAFRVGGRPIVWTSSLKNVGTATNPIWDMETTVGEDGEVLLKLASQPVRLYTEEVRCPVLDLSEDILGENGYADFKKYTEDLPE